MAQEAQTRRWTQDAAKREVGQRVNRPTTVQEKVNKVHDLLEDEKAAAQVATDRHTSRRWCRRLSRTRPRCT
ncbi:DUF6192 family protein [Nonomuraea sp. 3-1Str]|uniref:DUF6192 family protein n=1 Tax=Nonomuraea sp. 3-1Str TaxID=2929801 RepID=UPI0037C93503